MELFPPLFGFYQAFEGDARIGSALISLCIALLQQKKQYDFIKL
jgi:hypothetical protein